VAAILGHHKDGLTFGLYSKAQLVELKREYVEAVALAGAKPFDITTGALARLA